MMIPETIFNSNTKILRAIFFTAAQKYEWEWKELFNSVAAPDKRPFFEDLSIAGFGPVPEKLPGQTVAYDSIQEAYSIRYVYLTLALGYRAVKELLFHDQHNVLGKLSQLLAYSLHETEEVRYFNLLNLAFSGKVLGGDAKSLCATDHPLKKGGTDSNKATAAFSVTAYQNAKIQFRKQKGDEGFYSPKTPKLLVGSLDMEQKFFEVLKSEKAPYTTDNQRNLHYGDGMQYVNTKRITDTNDWFLLAKKADVGKNGAVQFSPDAHHMNVVTAWDNNFETDKDFDVKGMKTTVDKRVTYGFSSWRGVYGSQVA